MNTTFKTTAEAIAAGYRLRTPADRDITAQTIQDGFGYNYESPDGQKSVDVHLTDEKNSIGGFGAFRPMFPPSK